MDRTAIRVVQAATAALAAVSIGAGLWAMIDPHGFYASAATYPPYNVHLIHDIGAFQIGLGSCLVAGLLVGDALFAVLVGNAIAAVAHFVGHIVDRSIGGENDPVIFGVLALLFVLVAVARGLMPNRSRSP